MAKLSLEKPSRGATGNLALTVTKGSEGRNGLSWRTIVQNWKSDGRAEAGCREGAKTYMYEIKD